MKIQNQTKRRFAGLLLLFITVTFLFELNDSAKWFLYLLKERNGWGNQIQWENEFLSELSYMEFRELSYAVFMLVGTTIFYIMSILVLAKKKTGVVLHFLALPFLVAAIVFLQDYSTYIICGIYAVAFLLLQLGGGILTAPPKNEVIHAQMKKQTLLYNQQLKAGILTKEEYNQIMKTQK